MIRFIFFTDLDGTLLYHHTYSYEPAKPALALIKKTGSPLLLVSSKTRTELETIRTQLGNTEPFITENGGGIFIPRGYDLPLSEDLLEIDAYHAILLGCKKAEMESSINRITAQLPIRALSRLSVGEVGELTGLSRSEAKAAQEREFGEVLILDDPERYEQELQQMVRSEGLHLTRGGRFWHLLGENDKGRAVMILINLFRKRYPDCVTVGLGDAPNDAPMLSVVDRAFLVARPGGGFHSLDIPGLTRIPLPGPAGFNYAVLSLLSE